MENMYHKLRQILTSSLMSLAGALVIIEHICLNSLMENISRKQNCL